jgi:predicted nucleotidyltransferase
VGIAADTSLQPEESRMLERFLALLREEFGANLRAVWLYGSRARGEPPHPDSDVDVLVLTDGVRWSDQRRVAEIKLRAANETGANPALVVALVQSPQWVQGRRAIKDFFVDEVDRDKVVLFGER